MKNLKYVLALILVVASSEAFAERFVATVNSVPQIREHRQGSSLIVYATLDFKRVIFNATDPMAMACIEQLKLFANNDPILRATAPDFRNESQIYIEAEIIDAYGTYGLDLGTVYQCQTAVGEK